MDLFAGVDWSGLWISVPLAFVPIGLTAALVIPLFLATHRRAAARMPGGPARFRRAIYFLAAQFFVPVAVCLALGILFDGLVMLAISSAGYVVFFLSLTLSRKIASWRTLLDDLFVAWLAPHADRS
jgi:ABC-type cobalamin transport system permease subunit